jgi:hypothetical protein
MTLGRNYDFFDEPAKARVAQFLALSEKMSNCIMSWPGATDSSIETVPGRPSAWICSWRVVVAVSAKMELITGSDVRALTLFFTLSPKSDLGGPMPWLERFEVG